MVKIEDKQHEVECNRENTDQWGFDANRHFNQNNNYFLLLTDTFKTYSDPFFLVKRQMEGRLALLE